ncbi:hypothetical protein U9M48_011412 [Paspalum notatum var. saurae]|uniref:Secreted protein n=1 Tax=Paspalum notatum var. saurae TaxID=547442 RepID=A0AAQ3WHK4_PASNO
MNVLAADHLVLVVLLGELAEAGLDPLGVSAPAAAAEAQHEVQRRLLLDVVVGQGAAVLQLLPGEDEALLLSTSRVIVFPVSVFTKICILLLAGDRSSDPTKSRGS